MFSGAEGKPAGSCSCWGGAAPRGLSATTTRVLGALQKITQPQQDGRQGQSQLPVSILAGKWGPGPGHPLAWGWWQGAAVTVPHQGQHASFPPRFPLDFMKSHWEVVLAHISCMRKGNRHSLARQGNAMGRGPPWTITLRCIMCFASHEVHPTGHGMARGACGPGGFPGSLQSASESSIHNREGCLAGACVGTCWGGSCHEGTPRGRRRDI